MVFEDYTTSQLTIADIAKVLWAALGKKTELEWEHITITATAQASANIVFIK